MKDHICNHIDLTDISSVRITRRRINTLLCLDPANMMEEKAAIAIDR